MGLRVEERQPPAAVPVPAPQTAKEKEEERDLAYWRSLAIRSGERLSYAETQAADLRRAADDARARFSKYKDRLDKANERINALTTELIGVAAERDELRARLANQSRVSQAVHDYRKSLLEGPIWKLFEELAVSSPQDAGVERDRA